MVKIAATNENDGDYGVFDYEGFNWRYKKFINRHGNIEFQLWGPLCIRKKCCSQMENPEVGLYNCEICGYKNKIDYDGSTLARKARKLIEGQWAQGLKFTKLDKLPSVNESLQESNKFYRVAVEHDATGELRDIHILIKRKDNNSKKAHIILSPDGEIRFHKEDLPSEEVIKSITSIIFK